MATIEEPRYERPKPHAVTFEKTTQNKKDEDILEEKRKDKKKKLIQ